MRSDFHMTHNIMIADYAFTCRALMSFNIDERIHPRLVNLSSSFREPAFSVEMSLDCFVVHSLFKQVSISHLAAI